MNGNPPRDQKEKQASIVEVVNIEKLLWATIQHKGISNPEVQDLYREARSRYEKTIINDYQTVDLQELEYSLWKLHYKHIDEYRKKIKKTSTNEVNSHVEGFKLFLSEVAEFYKNLIAKFRRISHEVAKCNYVCHRFLVCLGDVSRYMELCKKPDAQKWAVAATYYLEATTVWPYSGNPHNQLALLATYIGDDFLALYHCIRSLAVKEPFPDARDNIMLLFEKNKSTQLQSLSTDAHIDFTKPLKRLSSQIKSHSSIDSTHINRVGANEHVPHNLWPLFVRMISFFLVKPSNFEDLPHTFASTMKELESLLALNDTELNSSLEPYEPFDPSRKGPYRAVQAVTILIFVIHNLTKTSATTKDEEVSAWAWTCTFSFMGHVIQRCITSIHSCALLPAVLVFLEWYAGFLEYGDTYGEDEKVVNAESYFVGALVDLLGGFDLKERETLSVNESQTLWEDHELRGFEPLALVASESSEFSTKNRYKFKDGNLNRITRVKHASVKVTERLKYSFPKENDVKTDMKNDEEEEEVILFKPLTRYNSEPIQTSNDIPVDQTESSEEGLRRSSSLFTGPPSLSGWVVNRESSNHKQEFHKQELPPISEIPTSSLADMSLSYVAPIPSAPLLPEEHGILGAPPATRLLETLPAGFIRPPVFGLSSSEWLYRYNNNLSLDPNHHWPVLGNNSPGNRYADGPRFDLVDKWGNPLLTNRMVYLENPYQREKVLFGYQRPNISGGASELRVEQPPPLQHLREREWQLQSESQFRGHPYMGN